MTLSLAAVLLSSAGLASAYCNGMNWPARTSTAFPPGWNGLAQTPPRGWRSWYAYATHMDQQMIELVVDALSARNRTVSGYDGLVSLCDLGFCSVGIDEGWEGCGLGGTSASAPTARPARNAKMRAVRARTHFTLDTHSSRLTLICKPCAVNGTQHYVNGTPAVNPKLFPDMRGLVQYGHAHGLRMGLYLNGCGCIERTEPASGWAIDYEGDTAALLSFGFVSTLCARARARVRAFCAFSLLFFALTHVFLPI